VTNYTVGRRLEYRARDELIAQGYTVVRSAGSKGPIDLVAIGRNVRLIQVKARSPRRSDRLKLAAVPTPRGVRREIWQWQTGTWRIHPV
jgi:hypothetical protein